jgi:hypothetical protein
MIAPQSIYPIFTSLLPIAERAEQTPSATKHVFIWRAAWFFCERVRWNVLCGRILRLADVRTSLSRFRTSDLHEAIVKGDPISYPPRGLSRAEAARYIGVGPTLFDEMVADRRMPKPKRVNNRTIWDRVELDIAFSALPGSESGLGALLATSPKAK